VLQEVVMSQLRHFGQHPRAVRRYYVHFASGCDAYTKDGQSSRIKIQ
jgi:hypothetical protein